MPNEIYHRSEWGNPKPEGWGNIYFDADATNELYKRSDNYENSNGTDEILRDISNKASIVLTPTAYDNGSINSVIPSTNTNLNVSFNNQNGWSWNGSVLSASPASGESRFINDRFLRQKTYLITFKVLSYTSGSLGYKFGGGSTFADYFNNDLIEGNIISFQAKSDASFPNLQFITSDFNGSLSEISFTELDTADFDFTRASIATRVNEQGVIEEVASGIPRIDYTSGFGSWLLEPFRRNIADYSEDGTEWDAINVTVSLDSSINKPDGIAGAYKVTDNTTLGQHRVDVRPTVVNGTQYAFSAFVKQAENSDVDFMFLFFASKFAEKRIYFNLSNGTAIGSDGTIEDYGNGWYRVSATATANADGVGVFGVNLINNDSGLTYAGTGNGAIYVFGMQVEDAGSGGDAEYVTSYIPTSGSIVTRSAETANNSGNADLFNDSEGVLYAEIAALADSLTSRTISISDGSNDNEVRIVYRTLSNQLNFQVRTNGGTDIFRSITVSDITEFAKVAFKYKSGESSVFVNGTEVITISQTFTFSNTLNQLRFEDGSSFTDFYGKTKELAVFKEALTDAELETLTSWVSFTQMATDLEYTLE